MPERADNIDGDGPLDERVDALLAEAEAARPAESLDVPAPPGEAEPGAPGTAAIMGIVNADLAQEDAPADEFQTPEAISRLDERLAEKADELSDAVDDSEIEEQIVAEEAGRLPPRASTDEPEPEVEAEADAPEPPPPAVERAPARPVVAEPEPARARTPIGVMLAAPLRPLAAMTGKFKPGTRQTIAYAAVITLFQAACLWGYLMFRGPAGDPEPTSEPVHLRQAEDPPAPPAGSARPSAKAPAKKDAQASADGH